MAHRPDAVIVDTSTSPHASWQGIAIDHVRLNDSVWEPRRRTTIESTLYSQHALLEETGRMSNFRRTAGTEPGGFASSFYFDDSDVYKWLEAAAWTMATDPTDELDRLIDGVVRELADAQQSDGYLNTWYTLKEAGKRWTELVKTHELYCAGHLFQAAVAHHRATGKSNLLDIAVKFADLICDTFGPEESGKMPGTDGHEEIEMALVELGRLTGNSRYIDQAGYFLDARGHGLAGGDEYHQDHLPFRDATEVVGHAVRQVYLTAGAADIYAETGDRTIRDALDALWSNMVNRRMYVSGGIGSRYEGEAFGTDFELPNRRAYTESCAAIGSVMWNWRMLLVENDPKYADLIEATLYNAMLPGLSLSGDRYFYQNPLEDNGTHRRRPWFDCACCPPNLARTLASIGGYFATAREHELALHLYARGTLATTLPSGQPVQLSIETDYPWDGQIRIVVEKSGEYAISLRIPGWAANALATVNGAHRQADAGSYLRLERTWESGDVIELEFSMDVRAVTANPYLTENSGRIAVFRGPILYCFEAQGGDGPDPRTAIIDLERECRVHHNPDLLGGVTTILATVFDATPDDAWNDQLYRPLVARHAGASPSQQTAELIPYFAWANRDPGPMAVWLHARN